jgi:hypothetical protein
MGSGRLQARRREILKALLARVTRIQLKREYPNAFLTKLLPIDWKRLASECGWGGETLAGCEAAWKAYRPGFFDLPDSRLRNAAQLAHVRFPLGGVHMALLSQDPELIGHQGPMAWDMLEKVDLARIESGETRYLFAVVALLLYAERHTSR